MKKWQELFFAAIMNFSVALMVGGIFGLVLDKKDVLASGVVLASGLYMLIFATILAKLKEK